MSALGISVKTNPYANNKIALAHSCYAEWREDKLVRVIDAKQNLSPSTHCAHGRFRSQVLGADFPCIGAKAAINGNCYRFGFYPQMNTLEATAGLAHDLWQYAQESAMFETDYATFAASFAAPLITSEQSWEEMLWTQLQNLHELDRGFYNWDETVSSDPQSAEFSFSFAQTGFFIVGLHAASSRFSRQFVYPTLIFNSHAQFERLRQQNKFDRMRQTIRHRDLKLQGSLNPNLSNFGEHSEARQYSGRAVETNWQCPFKSDFNNTVIAPDQKGIVRPN